MKSPLIIYLPASLFLISGVLGIVYEIIWQRQFALLFGSGTAGATIVLAAYFSGLAMGSWLIGRFGRKISNPLQAYAILELLIGLGSLLVTPILNIVQTFYPSLYLSLNSSQLLVVKGLLAFASILMPTFCMGGTLPVLSALMETHRGQLGRFGGLLYAMNTLGGAAGAAAVPMFLMPAFGLKITTQLAVACTLAIATLAFLVSRLHFDQKPLEQRKTSSDTNSAGISLLLLFSFLSGCGLFILQVIWNRALAQIHENSMLAFSIIVALFILSLAAGAEIGRHLATKVRSINVALAATWLFGAGLVFVGPWLFLNLTNGLYYLPAGANSSVYYIGKLLLVAAAGFVPAVVVLGTAFPLLLQASAFLPGAATAVVGRLLSLNLAGSVAGAFLGGVVLPSLFGMWKTVYFVSAIFAAAGIIQLPWPANRIVRSLLAFGVGAALFEFPGEPARVKLDEQDRLLALREGAHGIVAAVESRESRRLKLNNHYQLGGTSALGDERMQSHLPLLMHHNPANVAFLCVGTGITAGGALFHPQVKQIDAIELVPEVVELGEIFFADANNNIYSDPRATIIIDDARNYLRYTPRRYDLILGDLVVPWREGEGALYTVEHFKAAKAALAPGGVFCSWVPLFQITESQARIIMHTFLAVFGNAFLWRGDFSPTEPALALVALNARHVLDLGDLNPRSTAMRPDPSNPHLRFPGVLAMHYIGRVKLGDELVRAEVINSEDHPHIQLQSGLTQISPSKELFVGRKLLEWERRQLSVTERAANIQQPEQSALKAGLLLREFSISLHEGNRSHARRLQLEMKELLPSQTFSSIFPGE